MSTEAPVEMETTDTPETAEVEQEKVEAVEPGEAAAATKATATEATAAAEEPATDEAGKAEEAVSAADTGSEVAATGENNGEATGAARSRPGSLPEWWTDAYPQVTTVTSAMAYLDSLGGAMSRKEVNGRWVLWTGEQALFEASTEGELDGFVLGFALSQLIAERHGPIAHARRN